MFPWILFPTISSLAWHAFWGASISLTIMANTQCHVLPMPPRPCLGSSCLVHILTRGPAAAEDSAPVGLDSHIPVLVLSHSHCRARTDCSDAWARNMALLWTPPSLWPSHPWVSRPQSPPLWSYQAPYLSSPSSPCHCRGLDHQHLFMGVCVLSHFSHC